MLLRSACPWPTCIGDASHIGQSVSQGLFDSKIERLTRWFSDLKPDNVLLDANGHAHLSDFNIATQFNEKRPLRWSRAGSLAYMAPEILDKKGYSTSVDWWSLGVLAYELLFGKVSHSKGICKLTD